MDLYFQGLAWLNKGWASENVARARGFLERALIADPDNVDALIESARADIVEGAGIFVTDPMKAFATAEARLIKVLIVGPRPRAGPFIAGIYRDSDQARGAGHRQL